MKQRFGLLQGVGDCELILRDQRQVFLFLLFGAILGDECSAEVIRSRDVRPQRQILRTEKVVDVDPVLVIESEAAWRSHPKIVCQPYSFGIIAELMPIAFSSSRVAVGGLRSRHMASTSTKKSKGMIEISNASLRSRSSTWL